MLTENAKLAIAELVFYTPVLFLAAIVTIRHGFSKHLGWVYLFFLALVRIVGSILELVSMSNSSAGIVVAVVILSGIGLTPLLFAMLGLLQRVNDGASVNRTLPPRVFKILHLPLIVGFILLIVGGADLRDPKSSQHAQGQSLTQAAIILLIVDFAALSGITLLYYLPQLRTISPGEKPILFAVAASIPFILVRLIYSALVYFDTKSTAFKPVTGNVIIRAFMATLEEFVTVGLYLAAGLLAPKIPKGDYQGHKPLQNNQYELDHLTAGRSTHV